MVKLLIIADDFTGALDTGIQFAGRGIRTQIFAGLTEGDAIDRDTEVLVVDVESRVLNMEEAGTAVSCIMKWALEQKIRFVFKKTDSALRGNVGAELEAVSAAAGQSLYFIPANPQAGRITRGGVHYINGELLENSVFGKDPFNAVTKSHVADIIREQSELPVRCIESRDPVPEKTDREIVVCDAESMQDIEWRLRELAEKGKIGLVAGCAALADRLADILPFRQGQVRDIFRTDGLFIACGSQNPVTKEQLDYAVREGGFFRLRLTEEQKLLQGYYDTEDGKAFLEKILFLCGEKKKIIVDSFDTAGETEKFQRKNRRSKEWVRKQISGAHGRIVKEVTKQRTDMTVLLTGSDTLMGYMEQMGCRQLKPVREIGPGIVLSLLEIDGRYQQVISKSGGYGEPDSLCKIAGKIATEPATGSFFRMHGN